MRKEIVEKLSVISPEERTILEGGDVDLKRYNYTGGTVLEPGKLLSGRLFGIRTHTRFAAFPEHSHTYVEMIYQIAGSTRHLIRESCRSKSSNVIRWSSCRRESAPSSSRRTRFSKRFSMRIFPESSNTRYAPAEAARPRLFFKNTARALAPPMEMAAALAASSMNSIDSSANKHSFF